jgi:hypothetical protein
MTVATAVGMKDLFMSSLVCLLMMVVRTAGNEFRFGGFWGSGAVGKFG